MTYLPALCALLFSLGLVPFSIWVAHRYAMMDQPSARKVHRSPIPRIGGIGIFLSTVAAIALTLLARQFVGPPLSPELRQSLIAIGTAGFFIFLVGLVDDVRGVSSRFKLVALVGAAATVCGGGVVLQDVAIGNEVLLEFRWLGWLITACWIIGVAVAISFIDGLDGLAGGLTLISSSVLSLLAIASGATDVAILPLALSGALAGFMVFNWHPAKTFMGDCGSMTIGFLLASSIVLANPAIGTMKSLVVPGIAISIPLVESVLTVFRRRYLQRRSMFSAERGHIHHRLLDRGFSHPQVVVILLGISLLAVGIGLIALTFSGLATLAGLTLLVPLLWGTFKLAGSVRTHDMLQALRAKRALDRNKTLYRTTFEDMQLEFDQVANFSEWWRSVCRTAERLDFIKIQIQVPVGDGETREMTWESRNQELFDCDRILASIPVEYDGIEATTANTSVVIAANHSMESAGERLALFARLMTEYSIAWQRRRERETRSRMLVKHASATDPVPQPSRGDDSDGPFAGLRVALVHDFLYTYAGAERVLEQLIDVFPQADIFSLFDFLPESQRGFLRGKDVTPSFIQRLPFAKSKHRAYLPLMPIAIEQLDVSRYDLVLSSSYVAAKGVITGPDQLHVCYCHSPIRFAWDLQHQYMRESGLGFSPKGLIARWILHYIRNWDVRTSLGVDHFIANSEFIARRIHKVYRRKSEVIHPPVDTDKFKIKAGSADDFYLVSGRMVPYKRTDLIVRAFQRMPNRRLVVIGEGPGFEQVRELAGDNVTLLGFQDDAVLVDYMQRARGLIFAAEEDFGIVPVEAMSSGTPVIAYGRGGATETVIDGESGVLFEEQTEESLIGAVERFEDLLQRGQFDPDELHRHSLEFSAERFRDEISQTVARWVDTKWPSRGPGVSAKPSAKPRPVAAEEDHEWSDESPVVSNPIS